MAFALLLAGTAQAVPRSFFGVVPQAPLTADDFTRMGSAHVGLLRVQLSWATTDPGPATGDEDWSAFDAVVGGGAREGVRTLPFVFGTPTWVLALDGRTCRHERCPALPAEGRASARGLERLPRRRRRPLRPQGAASGAEHPSCPQLPIRAWQIWNEQNSPTFFAPQPSVRSYARLLTRRPRGDRRP